MLIEDYHANGRSSADRMVGAIKHLRAFFANELALDITSDRVTSYIK